MSESLESANAAMTPTKPAHLTHIALFVNDTVHTVDFYSRFVGLHVVHDRTDNGTRVVWLSEQRDDPDFVLVAITLPPGSSTTPPHMAHLGYDVPSRQAVDAIAAKAAAEGRLEQGPTEAGPIVGYFCILRDPDGNFVEFSHGQPIKPRQLP